MSMNSVTSNKMSHLKQSPIFQTAIEKVTVPGIGIASQMSDGVVEVVYPDGSRLAVKQPEQGGGIIFSQMNGTQYHYTARDELPEIVRNKLTHIPTVITHLIAHRNPTMPLCTPVSNKWKGM